MSKAIAISNNDVVQLAWSYDQKIPGCLGFAIFRQNQKDKTWAPLPAWVGFKGQNNDAWTANTTEVWPVQKFQWRDLTAKAGESYIYRIVPTKGTPSTTAKLQTLDGQALLTNKVTLTPDRGEFRAYFNRGILSTQALAHKLPAGPSGTPNFKALMTHISNPADPIRKALAGQMLEGLELLLKRASTDGGSCYLALYELTDPELLPLLEHTPNLHIILSNTGTDDKENEPAREALHGVAGLEMLDRFVPSGHIGHNKFCVYADTDGNAEAVLLGSTNWTNTAVCAQSNNALVVENAELADAYLKYWKRLKADTSQGAKQGATLRTSDKEPGARDVPVDAGKATVWFSPNTPHARVSHPSGDEETPPDLTEVFDLMSKAKQGILFLEFQPGTPSVIDHAAELMTQNPDLFVRGAATDPKAVDDFKRTTLFHRPGEEPVDVVAATAINDQFEFWRKELLKASPTAHAIIHDKIVVIDPMSPDCVVVTGSHNQGYRASYNNDENMLIVRGHQALAQAYAVHVMDVYDHYRFRYEIQQNKKDAFSGLDPSDDWQNKYFDETNAASKDTSVWLEEA